jgi:hypothetical protein
MGRFKVGQWVEVRSKEEILTTLDAKGQLDGMPFMPEMFQFCGKKFQVYKSAHKTCDTVTMGRGRRVDKAVHLDTRCDGTGHGGCQAGCLLFWKQAWLKPVELDLGSFASAPLTNSHGTSQRQPAGCTELDVLSNAFAPRPHDGVPIYTCQATRLPDATAHLPWWNMRQYVDDYTSGNVGLRRMFVGLMYSAYFNLSQAGIGLGRPMRWLYDLLSPLWGGPEWPRKTGTIPKGNSTPLVTLNLQPGETVRVKSHREILTTLNTDNQNRGMGWDAELVPYCGGTYQVLKRVHKFINEKTGEMQEMKNPGIILDSVVCQGRYSGCRMFCPRSIYSWWREIWLERTESTNPLCVEDEQHSVLKPKPMHEESAVKRITFLAIPR